MHEPYSSLLTPPHSPPSHSPAKCSGAAYLWTLLNGALVWPDSSPLLHFPSSLPAQPSDCHRKSCQDFPLFLHRSTFPSALTNNSDILPRSTPRVSPLLSSFFLSALSCLFINRLFHPGFMSKQEFL